MVATVVRSLESFTRFLEVAALANAQVTNVAALARDAAVARPTVQGYFDALVDTLIGAWLPAWRPRAKVKEARHPKFYLFDTGVVRALSRRLREPLDGAERGALLETLVYHELRAQVAYSQCGGEFSYYRTPSGSEVDFVWVRGQRAVGIEVKASARWREEYGRALADLYRAGVLTACHGVYLGDRPLQAGAITVLPLDAFLRRLTDHLIEKAIRSLEAQLVQHRAWIKDPFLKLSRSADPQRIRDLVQKKWPKDINRHQEQIEISRGIIQERRK